MQKIRVVDHYGYVRSLKLDTPTGAHFKSPGHTLHPVHFKKTLGAPFCHMSPQLRGAWSAHEQTCTISREELPRHLKQKQEKLRKDNIFVFLPLWWRFLISVFSCAEWG